MSYMDNNAIIKAFRNKVHFLLHGQGGQWLGQARNWIQWNCRNGSDVTWGSDDTLNMKPMTVREIESLAADIAKATLEEFKSNLVTDEEMRALRIYRDKRNWKPNTEGKGMMFDPQHGLHFAQWKVDNGWEVAEFDEDVRVMDADLKNIKELASKVPDNYLPVGDVPWEENHYLIELSKLLKSKGYNYLSLAVMRGCAWSEAIAKAECFDRLHELEKVCNPDNLN